MHDEEGEEEEDEHKVWHPGSRTPTQTHAQTTAICVAGDGAGARQTSGERGGGERAGACEYGIYLISHM